MKVRAVASPEEEKKGQKRYTIFCPGCKCGHAFRTPDWNFNGDMDKPTVSPSLLVTEPGNDTYRCHSYIRDGSIQFLPDCSHALKGQTVSLEEF